LILTEFTENKQDLDIWRFKYSSFLRTGTYMWWGKGDYLDSSLPSWYCLL